MKHSHFSDAALVASPDSTHFDDHNDRVPSMLIYVFSEDT